MEEYKYPMWFKSKDTDVVVKFMGLQSGTIVKAGNTQESKPVGFSCDNFIKHTNDNNWEDVSNLYNPLKFGSIPDNSLNNGGKTDYYQLPEWIKDFDDFAEWRGLNGFQFNMGKAMWTFNTERHSGTNEVRDLNKIIHYAQRELKRIENEPSKH